VRAKTRLAAVAAALLAPGWILAAWLRAGIAPVGALPPASLPREVGPWIATEEGSLDPEVLEMIAPDVHLLRRYEAPGRAPVWVYLGLYASRGSFKKAAHDPEICYPAQGWEVVRSRSVAVELPPGPAVLRAKLLDVHQGLEREAALYWFQPAQRWPASGALEEVLRIADAVGGAPQYGFVRLSSPSEGRPEAAGDLLEFARLAAPSVRTSVEILRPSQPLVTRLTASSPHIDE
jgi:EpsI family protein